MSPALVILLAGGLAVLAIVTLLAWQQAAAARRQAADTMAVVDAVSRRLESGNQALNSRLDGVSGELNRTLTESLQKTTQALAGSIGSAREETRARLDEKFVQITERLGALKATNDRIMEFGRSLDDFQRMLQSPKLRGDFGEFTLEQMLANLLPAECYACQVSFSGVRVDAVISTPHGDLCVDSKFPLDNFRRALEAPDEPARAAALKAFYADVRGRMDEIAGRYVAPPATLDMALMFVPAENVYYELLGRPELLKYGRERRVVPVSPNTMYAYLQALAVGFRGLKIHQEARRVERMLADLRDRFDRFYDHFQKIGRHLENAQTQYQSAVRDVDRFQTTLDGLKVGRLEEPETGVGPEEPTLPLLASRESEPDE